MLYLPSMIFPLSFLHQFHTYNEVVCVANILSLHSKAFQFTKHHLYLFKTTIDLMKCQAFQQVLPAELHFELKNIRERQVLIRSSWRKGSKTVASINCSSGFLISQSLVLTSAHNIYSCDLKQPASQLIIFFNNSTNSITHNSPKVQITAKLGQNIIYASGERGFMYDMALVKLPHPRLDTGPNPLKMLKSLSVRYSEIVYAYVSGFPDLQARDCSDYK